MGGNIQEKVSNIARELGFANVISLLTMIESDGPEYFAHVSLFARNSRLTYSLASELNDDGRDLVGDVRAQEIRERQLRNFLEKTEFGMVHSWIVEMWDETG